MHLVRVGVILLLGSIPLSSKAQKSTELEISVKSVSRLIEQPPKELHVVVIEFELTNRSEGPLFIGVCCWKDLPLQLHNPAVDQLLPDGKWTYVGGNFTELPAPFWKRLEPGSHFQGDIRIADPYRELSIPGDRDMRPGYFLPIRGKHRIRIRYSYIKPIDPTVAKERPRNKFVEAHSDTFEIPPEEKEKPTALPQKQEHVGQVRP
jgi:hypothetical protein